MRDYRIAGFFYEVKMFAKSVNTSSPCKNCAGRNSYIFKLCQEFSYLADLAIVEISAGGDFSVSQKFGLTIITCYTVA